MAIQEMHRAVTELEMVGIQIGCTVREDTLLSDIRLDPFWAEAERLNVAIAVHGSALPSFFRSYFDVNRPDHMLEASHMAHTFAQMLACSNLITGGVLERFPKLRIAFLKPGRAGCPTGCTAWMSTTRWRRSAGRTFRRNPASTSRVAGCFLVASRATSLSLFLEHVGEDAMLFASDYLHFDALFVGEQGRDGKPYPGTVATLMARQDIPDSTKRKMVLDNSLNFYAMDQSKLGRIGTPVTRPEPEAARQAVLPGTLSARVTRAWRAIRGQALLRQVGAAVPRRALPAASRPWCGRSRPSRGSWLPAAPADTAQASGWAPRAV